jgi:hypothetical protein
MCKHFSGGVSRPDLAACVTSGLFDLCIKAITAVAAAGVDGLQDTHHSALYYALSLVRICRAQPECEGKIRGTANALAFCLMNDLECVITLGNTTAAMAAQICENPCGAPSRGEAHTKSSMLHRHICLTPSAGPVVQVVVCSAATKVALTSASHRNTLKTCEWTHRVQCGSAVAARLLNPLPTCCAFCNADVQAREMVTDRSCSRLVSEHKAHCRQRHGFGALRLRFE